MVQNAQDTYEGKEQKDIGFFCILYSEIILIWKVWDLLRIRQWTNSTECGVRDYVCNSSVQISQEPQ